MESNLYVKANREEMRKAFDESTGFSVRSFEEVRNGLFKSRIRHKELKDRLTGTFTIQQLNEILK